MMDMINWIIGGIIAVLTVLIIVNSIRKTKKGGCSCCDGCPSDECSTRKT